MPYLYEEGFLFRWILEVFSDFRFYMLELSREDNLPEKEGILSLHERLVFLPNFLV